MPDTVGPSLVPDWTLGWRLNRALAHAGISMQTMADALEVSRQTISRWINDHGAPPRAIYVKEWALRCGVDYQWLATGQEREQDVPAARRSAARRVKNP